MRLFMVENILAEKFMTRYKIGKWGFLHKADRGQKKGSFLNVDEVKLIADLTLKTGSWIL